MRYVLAGFPSALRASSALGGKAPAGWQRDLARKIAGLAAVRRGSAWVEEFGAIHPKLCKDPLLGTTLTILTGQVSQSQEAQPKAVKARFARWGNPLQFSDRRSAAKRKILKQTAVGRSTEILSQLPAQASYLLLSRLAGSELELEGPERKLAKPFPKKLREKGSEDLLIRRGFYPPTDLFNRLARRARKAMNRKQPDAAGTAKPAQEITQPSVRGPSLAEQWAMPLDGRGVSRDLLDQLAYTDLAGVVGVGSEAAPLKTPPRHISDSRQPLRRSDKWDRWQWESVSGGNKLGPMATPPVIAEAGSAFFAPEFGVNGQEGHSAGESQSSAPIVPPNVTAFLPDLLPRQRVAAPLPVAAATARRGAREEAMMAMDDLEVLAAKIKQILDDQARRHGIDV